MAVTRRHFGISIPAFREEGDSITIELTYILIISIPAFREEGDGHGGLDTLPDREFQSPPSVRKATRSATRGPLF